MTVEYTRPDGSIGGAQVRVFDFDNPENNDWVAVNQFTVVEGQNNRRPDVLIFVNGLPIALMELKNPADENATIWTAFKQIQTYKAQIPSLFTYNELLIISDGMEARVGSLTADTERFMPWRTIEGEELAPPGMVQLQVVIQGLLDKRRLLDFIRYFVVFEDEGGGVLTKKIAGYHQFHAVNRALATTIQASAETGDRRVGVVWHTQGSGKSLTMAFYAGRLVLEPRLENPTIVVITDRNDLDDQLFGTFSRCHELLRQAPEQAVDREDLRARLNVSTGHVVFTTIQKFMPTERDSQSGAYRIGGTSSSSPTRRIAASTTSSTASRGTCAMLCLMRRSSGSRALPSRRPTPTPGRYSATTSACTTSSERSKTRRPCRSTTRADWQSSNWTRAEKPKIDPDFEEVTEGEETERRENGCGRSGRH